MSDIAIKVENVSKCYRLGERGGYRTIRESLSKLASVPARWLKRGNQAAHAAAGTAALAGDTGNPSESDLLPPGETDVDAMILSPGISSGSTHTNEPTSGGDPDTFWALRDVSFEVKRGEVLGIIGRNGAGKSTLLKILSRITEPTSGRIDLYGRVASLLEVGTGFHPELTGRENIYLNGAILGMTRAEINRQFDAIIDFAGVEKFLDTPVKRYSSGMRVRLGFAVAAHLEPEILIVDEVLAVGDAEFQRSCMGKMDDVARSGRTVLFVSHNMGAINRLCDRVAVLESGRLDSIEMTEVAISNYYRLVSGSHTGGDVISMRGGGFDLAGVRIEAAKGGLPRMGAAATFRIPVRFDQPCGDPHIHLFVQDSEGETIFGFGSDELKVGLHKIPRSCDFEFKFDIKSFPLIPGRYRLCVKVRSYERGINERIDLGDCLEVPAAPLYGTSIPLRMWHGLVAVDASVSIESGPGFPN